MNLIKAMATVAGMTAISRVAGFTRDILTAAILGAGPVADAFFVALKLPNFFRRVTAEGAFSVSFVPLYSETLEKEGEKEAEIFANNAFAMMLALLSGFVLLAMLTMPWIICAIAPGFSEDPTRYSLAVEMSRITFPYLLFMSLTSLLGGVLNAHEKFAPFASAPIIFNLSLITALLCGNFAQTVGHAMAWGIFAAGILQFLWLLINTRKIKYRLHLVRPKMTFRIKKVFALMGPGVIGAGVMHINLFADLMIASLLPEGSISYLYYADRLNQLPLGVVGIAVGTALLPMLSKALAANNTGEAKGLFSRALEVCLLLGVPAAIALLIIPHDLIRILFERGEFTPSDTLTTGFVLMGYAVGMPAYICVKVLSTAYWARQDTKTPVKISVMCTAINITLSLTLIHFIGVAGISAGTGTAGWLQFILLKRGLKDKKDTVPDERFRKNLPKIIASALIMGAVLLGASEILSEFTTSESRTILKICSLAALVSSGMITYGIAVFTFGVLRVKDISVYFKRK